MTATPRGGGQALETARISGDNCTIIAESIFFLTFENRVGKALEKFKKKYINSRRMHSPQGFADSIVLPIQFDGWVAG
jgi:hypothetical protein